MCFMGKSMSYLTLIVDPVATARGTDSKAMSYLTLTVDPVATARGTDSIAR